MKRIFLFLKYLETIFSLKRIENFFRKIFPYYGLEKKLTNIFLKEIENSNWSTEDRFVALASLKYNVKLLKNDIKAEKPKAEPLKRVIDNYADMIESPNLLQATNYYKEILSIKNEFKENKDYSQYVKLSWVNNEVNKNKDYLKCAKG